MNQRHVGTIESGTLCAVYELMVWLEMIRLRARQGQTEDVLNLLLNSVRDAAGEQGLSRVYLYNSACCCTELALSLVWNTDPPQRLGSRAGLSISEALKTFGLVDHSIWVEVEMRQMKSS
jgi:hypothetical protein